MFRTDVICLFVCVCVCVYVCVFLANHVINTCMTHKVHAIFEQHLRNVFRTFIGHEPDMVYLRPGVVL